MDTIDWIIFALAVAAFSPVVAPGLVFGRAVRRAEERAAAAAAELASVEAEKKRGEEEARRILYECRKALKAHRAVGFGPWIASLLEVDEGLRHAREITPALAVTALRLTIDDLRAWRPQETGYLYQFIDELMEICA